MPSADGTQVTGPGTILLDDLLNAYRLVDTHGKDGIVVEWQPVGTNVWKPAGFTANAKVIEKWQATIYHESPPSEWSTSGWWRFEAPATWHPAAGSPSAEQPPIDQPPIVSGEYYCLLYTSPSPRDGLLSRMPSSA